MTSEKPVRAVQGLGSTGREVGVLREIGGLVQHAQLLASAPRASCSSGPGSSPGSGDRPSGRRRRRRSAAHPHSGTAQPMSTLLTFPESLLKAEDAAQLDVLPRLLGVSASHGPGPDAVQLGGPLALQRLAAETGPAQTGQGDGLAVIVDDVRLGMTDLGPAGSDAQGRRRTGDLDEQTRARPGPGDVTAPAAAPPRECRWRRAPCAPT